MFDGKKIKRGTDIDLLGFESEPASERKEKFQQDMVVIQKFLEYLQEIDQSLEMNRWSMQIIYRNYLHSS